MYSPGILGMEVPKAGSDSTPCTRMCEWLYSVHALHKGPHVPCIHGCHNRQRPMLPKAPPCRTKLSSWVMHTLWHGMVYMQPPSHSARHGVCLACTTLALACRAPMILGKERIILCTKLKHRAVASLYDYYKGGNA